MVILSASLVAAKIEYPSMFLKIAFTNPGIRKLPFSSPTVIPKFY